MNIRWFTFLLVMALAVSSCGGTGTTPVIEVQAPWVRAVSALGSHEGEMSEGQEPIMSANGAAYMLLRNPGGEEDRLLRVESDVADVVELHISEMKDGVMSMHPVEYIEVPAKGQVELKPGGLHMMLVGLKRDLVAGDKVTLILEFEASGTITVEAEVRAP